MKKHLYIFFALLSLTPSMATQKIVKSAIVASSLVLSGTNSKPTLDKTRSLALHRAIEKRDYPSAAKLIKDPQVDINAKVNYSTNWWDKKGTTPLIQCCWQGDKSLAIAKLLLKHRDIDVNLKGNDGTTPLIRCCWEGDKSLKIAKALLKRNTINVNLQNNHGYTPLIVCCRNEDTSLAIAKLLLKRKDIDVNLKDNDGNTPLILCCIEGDKLLHIVKLLLETRKINVNLQDKYSYTPLDNIVYQIKNNKKNYTYVKLWNVLVAKGAVLVKCKNDYNNLNPSHFKELKKSYIQSIKNNPPKNHSYKNVTKGKR